MASSAQPGVADNVSDASPSGILPYVIGLSEWAQASGIVGMACYCVMLAIVIVVNIPCGPLELLPGFLFGQLNGFLVALVGKTLGNFFSVWLAKTCLRGCSKKTFQGLFLFRVVQRMLSDTGIFTLVLVRTLYMPMGVKNTASVRSIFQCLRLSSLQ